MFGPWNFATVVRGTTRSFTTQLSNTFLQARKGLYAGKHIQFGNNKPFSKHKTRRTWLPNIQRKRLYSPTLKQWFQLKVTTAALRTIDKHGGLDGYLLGTKDAKLQSDVGLELKRQLQQTLGLEKPTRKSKKTKAVPSSEPLTTNSPVLNTPQ